MHLKLLSPLALACLLSACTQAPGKTSVAGLSLVSEAEGGRLLTTGAVSVLELQGSYREMGRQYGTLLRTELGKVYESLVQYYTEVAEPGARISYDRMKVVAEYHYRLYPQRYREVILGMAETSGLGLEKQQILNALEVLAKINGGVPRCSAMAAWGQYTGGGPLILGRNNDDDLLYKRFGGSTVVVALRPTDSSIPAAFINYLGVIYSPTGMNRDGLILELNSGSSFRTDINRDLTLLHLLSWLQDYSTLDEVWPAFKSLRPNMSVLVNGADRKGAVSFECPLELECKRRGPDRDGLLAGTNHFTDPSWGTQFPEVLGTSWETDRGAYGATVARQRNLLALGDERKGQIDAAAMKAIFDTPLDVTTGKGGATVAGTIQSMVLVPQTLTLHLKAPGSFDWQKIELETLLNPQ